jgi:integrase
MKDKTFINFTKATLVNLPIPQKGLLTFCDTQEKGLSLYVTPSGHKSFMVRKRINRKNTRMVLGTFPDMTVDMARKAAQRIKGEIACGKDPLEDKKKTAEEITFGEAYEMYMEKHAKIKNKYLGRKDAEQRIKKILPLLGPRKLSSISKKEIRNLHERMGEEDGKYTANRVLAYIGAIYNKMISWDWEGTNPTIGIEKFKEQKRDRFILQDELGKFMDALKMELNKDMRDLFTICLFTGARKSNVLSMRWEDIDFNLNEWRIPDTKNGDPLRVPLIGLALEILNHRIHLKETSPWVFPAKSKSGHIKNPKKAWIRILKQAGLTNLRIHDLRRTCASYQAINGSSLTIIGKSLGHKSPQSTAVYARLSNDPVRTSMESAFDWALKR